MNLMVQIGNGAVSASGFTHLCFLLLGRVKSWNVSALRNCHICPYRGAKPFRSLLKDYIEIQIWILGIQIQCRNHEEPFTSQAPHYSKELPEASHLWQKDLFGFQVMDEADQVSKLRPFYTHGPL